MIRAIPLLVLAAAAALSSASLGATDYSKMFEPPYARLHLLTGQRMRQMECAGLALHFRDARPNFSKEMAGRIADAVTRRVAADLGDAKTAREFVEGKAYNHSSPTYSAAERAEITGIIEGQCRSLFDAAEKGDSELEAALGPIPSKPLELPDPGQCLAVISYAAERKLFDEDRETEQYYRKAWIDGAPEAERSTRKAKLDTAVSMLRSLAPGDDQLHGMFAACAPTIQAVMSEAMLSGQRP